MGKSKRAPALFEVIEARQLQGSSSRFPLPKWWRGGRSESPNYPPASQPDPTPAEPDKIIKLVPQFDRPVAQEKPPVQPPRAESIPPKPPGVGKTHPGETAGTTIGGSAGSAEKPPAVGVGGGRVHFSLNPVSLCIAFGVVTIVLVVAYQLGKGYGPLGPRTDDPIEDVRRQPSDPTVVQVSKPPKADTPRPGVAKVDGGTRSTGRGGTGAAMKEPSSVRPATGIPAAAASSAKTPEPGPEAEPKKAAEPLATAPPPRVKGLNYLYIVRFRAEHRDDATHARNWLSSKGIKTAIEQSGDGLSLVSVDGFEASNTDDKAKRMAMEAKLKELSPVYRQDCRAEQRDRYYAFDKPELRKQKD